MSRCNAKRELNWLTTKSLNPNGSRWCPNDECHSVTTEHQRHDHSQHVHPTTHRLFGACYPPSPPEISELWLARTRYLSQHLTALTAFGCINIVLAPNTSTNIMRILQKVLPSELEATFQHFFRAQKSVAEIDSRWYDRSSNASGLAFILNNSSSYEWLNDLQIRK